MKKIFHIFLFMWVALTAVAQQEQEVGLRLGISNYLGDLVPQNVDLSQSGLSVGLTYRRLFTAKLGLSASASLNKIKADERNYDDRLGRGAVMDVNLIELAATGEWHPFGRNRFNDLGVLSRRLSPYLYLGLGVALGETKLEFTGDKTMVPESNRSSYFIMPFGGGLRYNISDIFTITADLGARPVFSDQLDGVSINGNSAANDWYLQGGFCLLYNLL